MTADTTAPATVPTPAEDYTFDMVAKTMGGLEDVLARELADLGAADIATGRRMVAFRGDKALLYKANMHLRTALRVLKPFHSFRATDTDDLYEKVKAFDWGSLLDEDKTFMLDVTTNSDTFNNSLFITYRVKDAIADWFQDRHGLGHRPGVRTEGNADVKINVHINDRQVTLSLDSSGTSLHQRGYRSRQTDAPINEVLAAGILLLSGYDGSKPLMDPMCGSGTFLIEAAMIAAGIAPGIYRKRFAFESWPDFDADLWSEIYNDDSRERPVTQPIIGGDISRQAIEIADANIRGAGLAKYITLRHGSFIEMTEKPAPSGVIVTNPPYGERISVADMDGLYTGIGTTLKRHFPGWEAWIIGYKDDYFAKIGLAPSAKVPLMNGPLDCSLRQYVVFDGTMQDFRRAGGKYKEGAVDRLVTRPPKKEGDRHSPRKDDRRPPRKDDRKVRPSGPSGPSRPTGPRADTEASESENPLAVKRNPHALKAVGKHRPQLAADKTVLMRDRAKRRAWFQPGKGPNDSDTNDTNNDNQ